MKYRVVDLTSGSGPEGYVGAEVMRTDSKTEARLLCVDSKGESLGRGVMARTADDETGSTGWRFVPLRALA